MKGGRGGGGLTERKWGEGQNLPYTLAEGVELFMVEGPLMTPGERSSSDPR